MEKIKCKTLDECLKVIQVYKLCGQNVPEYILLQKEEFERIEKEKIRQKEIDECTPIFSTLKANSKFTYSNDLIECISTTVEKLLEAELKNIINTHAGILTEKYKVSWLKMERTVVNTDQLKADNLYQKYSNTSVTRSLRIFDRKKKAA